MEDEKNKVYASLREKYNPDGSKLRQFQLRLLTILVEWDKFCKEHDLSYSLAYGTLLGAVRHNGFIPWDDDADVMMTHEQYEALVKLVGVEDIVYLTDKLFIRKRVKPEICLKDNGFIDLFLVDYVPTNRFKQKWKLICLQLLSWLYRCRLHYEMWKNSRRYHFKAWHILMPIGICRSLEKWQHDYDKVRSWFTSKDVIDTTKICNYTSPMQDIALIYPADLFDENIYIDFEGYSLPCIIGYDKFLSIRYGDYKSLPKSIRNHGRIKG